MGNGIDAFPEVKILNWVGLSTTHVMDAYIRTGQQSHFSAVEFGMIAKL